MPRNNRRVKRQLNNIETLESRRLLAGFGTPWLDARDLSISLPADGVGIDGYDNVLRESLDSVTDRENWEELILRAYQTWAIHADINIGLQADHDLDFGTPGLSGNDPRFGEFRIGAFPQSGVLANSLPFQAVAGTWSGDLFLNSNELYSYDGWIDGVHQYDSSQPTEVRDLFSVLLHEVGNTLGIADTTMTSAVMFGYYRGPKGLLTPDDIAWLQDLYGQRTDPYELSDNGQLELATVVPTPIGFDPSLDRISVRGSIASDSDQDHYRISPIAGTASMTLTVKAKGVSLLKPRIEVYDQNGLSLAHGVSVSVFDNDVTVTIANPSTNGDLSVRVASAASDIYSVGDYVLHVDYRSDESRWADPVPGDYNHGIETLGENFGLADTEVELNDTLLTALSIAATDGFAPESRFEWVAAVSGASDLDYFKVTAPSNLPGKLVINLASIGADAPELKVRLLDSNGATVGATGRLRRDGTWVLEVAQPVAGADYFVQVSVDPNSVVDVGNYVASAEFVAESAQMNQFISGSVSTELDDLFAWTSTETRIYRFDLTGYGAEANQFVRLTIYDAVSHDVRMVLSTPSGTTRSAFALLPQGDYILRFTAQSRDNSNVADIGYHLTSDGISDDQDPDGNGTDPDYYDYNYYYHTYYDPVYYGPVYYNPGFTENYDYEYPYYYMYYYWYYDESSNDDGYDDGYGGT